MNVVGLLCVEFAILCHVVFFSVRGWREFKAGKGADDLELAVGLSIVALALPVLPLLIVGLDDILPSGVWAGVLLAPIVVFAAAVWALSKMVCRVVLRRQS